jgi:hypothetical protein
VVEGGEEDDDNTRWAMGTTVASLHTANDVLVVSLVEGGLPSRIIQCMAVLDGAPVMSKDDACLLLSEPIDEQCRTSRSSSPRTPPIALSTPGRGMTAVHRRDCRRVVVPLWQGTRPAVARALLANRRSTARSWS